MNQRKSYLFGLRHQMSDINDVIITHVAIDTFIPGYIQIYIYIVRTRTLIIHFAILPIITYCQD